VASHVLDFDLELLLGSLLRALEGNVFKEVSSAVILCGLISAARINPDTNRSRLSVGSLRRVPIKMLILIKNLKNREYERLNSSGRRITSDATLTPFPIFETSVTGALVM
jgi:hypothetical protein